MTAINIFKAPGAVHLMTDGSVASTTDGSTLFFMSKVVDCPHLSAVVVSRNAIDMSSFVVLPALVQGIASFDAFAEAFPHLVAQAQQKLTAAGYPPLPVEVVLAGVDGSGTSRALHGD